MHLSLERIGLLSTEASEMSLPSGSLGGCVKVFVMTKLIRESLKLKLPIKTRIGSKSTNIGVFI